VALLPAMKIKPLPPASSCPRGLSQRQNRRPAPIGFTKSNMTAYRMIVHRDGPTVRLDSRNAYDWTVRQVSIAAAAELIKAKSFTIDGEAVGIGPDGLSRVEELSRRRAIRAAVLCRRAGPAAKPGYRRHAGGSEGGVSLALRAGEARGMMAGREVFSSSASVA
jgi:hypothetical protein